MSAFTRLFGRSSAPSEASLLREELRLARLQMEADRTALHIQEQNYKRIAARFGIGQQEPPRDQSALSDEIKLRESWPGWFTPGAFGAIINPLSGFYDGIQPLMSTVPTLWDYTLNLGFYVTEAWLDILRMYARVWYSVTPQAQGVLKAIRDYVIHTGFDYQVQPKPGLRVAQSLPAKAQRVVDDFLTANQWFETEQDWHTRLHRDGEVFPRLFPMDSGITQVRTVEPWQVRGGNTTPENLFGVNTEPGDREKTRSYNLTMSGSTADAEEVFAFGTRDEYGAEVGRMTVIKINSDKQVKRGVSDFVATQQLFRDMTTLLQNTAVGEALRQALVWVQETTGAANPLVEMTAGGSTIPAGYTFAAPGTWGPGQIPTMDKNLQFKDGPKGSAANAQVAAQLAYQALSVYFRVPEWMVSGTSAANFAASLTQESPLVRMAQAEQKFLKNRFSEVVTMALTIAEEQEILEPGTVAKVTLNTEATPLVVRDAKGETDRNAVLAEKGLLSKRTWSVREELDRDAELESMEEERAYDAAHPAPTPPAPPGKPGQPPAAGVAPSTTPAAELARQAPRPESGNEGLKESVRLREEQSRGQPGNAGQFGSGGGAAKDDADEKAGKKKGTGKGGRSRAIQSELQALAVAKSPEIALTEPELAAVEESLKGLSKTALGRIGKAMNEAGANVAGSTAEELAESIMLNLRHREKERAPAAPNPEAAAQLDGAQKAFAKAKSLESLEAVASAANAAHKGLGYTARQAKVDEAVAGAVRAASEDAGERKMHGMAKAEPMRKVTIGGTQCVFADTPEGLNAAALSLRSMASSGHHPKLLAANKEIAFTGQKNAEDGYWEKEYGIKGFESNATGGDGRIVVYGGASIGADVFAHESGHNLAAQTWGATRPNKDSEYGRAQASEPPVSEYGSKSEAEDFAEAVMMYNSLAGRDTLKTKFPKKFTAIQNLLGDGASGK